MQAGKRLLFYSAGKSSLIFGSRPEVGERVDYTENLGKR